MGVIDVLIWVGDRINARFGPTDPAEHLTIERGEHVAIRRLSKPTVTGARPLVVALHGFGTDEHQMATLVPLHRSRAHVHHVAVRGGWTVADGGYAWFPIEGSSPSDTTADSNHLDEAADRLASVVRRLTASPSVDPDQVWIIGYSQGAPTALHLLFRHPDLLRGVAIGAGGFVVDPTGPLNISHASCFVASSTNDPFISNADYADTLLRLHESGAAVETCEEAVPHVISSTQADAIDHWLLKHL